MYAQKKAGDYEAQVGANNAQMAGWQRAATMQGGANEAAAIQAKGASLASSAVANLGASGIDTTTGSAANIPAASALNAATDAAQTKANAARAAWGYEIEGGNAMARAQMARKATFLGVAGTGLAGLASSMNTYSQYKTK